MSTIRSIISIDNEFDIHSSFILSEDASHSFYSTFQVEDIYPHANDEHFMIYLNKLLKKYNLKVHYLIAVEDRHETVYKFELYGNAKNVKHFNYVFFGNVE